MKPAALPREKERAMKHGTIIIVSLMLLLGLGGCKRNAANDPGGDGPAAYQITLKGTANPSTLFIPRNKSEVRSVITVRAIYNDGTPVVDRDVYFTLDTALGYFSNYQPAIVRPTGGNGEVQVLYIIPSGTVLASDGFMNIEARLYADNRLDNPLSEIVDIIPMQIMAAEYDQTPITLCGKVKMSDDTGLANAIVELTETSTGWTTVLISRASGSWDVMVPFGWQGTIKATLSGFSFLPASYTFGASNPAYQSRCDLDFISVATIIYGSMNVDDSSIVGNAPQDVTGLTPYTIYVTNSLNDNEIQYTISSSNPSWLQASQSTGSTNENLPNTANAYGDFDITVENDNDTGSARTGTITITSITPGVTQTETVTVTQDP